MGPNQKKTKKGKMAKKKVIHIFLTKKKRDKLKPRILIFIILIIIVLLQGIKLQAQNELAIKDYEYAYMLTQIKRQIQENAILQEEILDNESLTTITRKAIERGFVPAKYIFL